MRIKPTPDRQLDPPEPEPVQRREWDSAFRYQWYSFQNDADAWGINLGSAEEAADFSWENDGFEQAGDDAARQELLSRFDCICSREG